MIPLRSKVDGLLNLQCVFEKHPALAPLDFFVVLSSASGVVGVPGQANYAAAGVFQDAFVHFRQTKGQPASVLDLGIVTKVGYVHVQKARNEEFLKNTGFAELSPTFLHKAFEMAIGAPIRGQSESPTSWKSIPIQDESQFFLGLDLSNTNGIKRLNKMRQLLDRKWAIIQCAALETAHSNGTDGLSDLTNSENPFKGDMESCPADEVIDEVTALIIRKTAAMMMIPFEDIKPEHSLQRYGMDSLVAVETKNWLYKACMVELSVTDIMEASSIRALGEKAYRVYMRGQDVGQSKCEVIPPLE